MAQAKIDRLFREALESYTMVPNKHIWPKLEYGLKKQEEGRLWQRIYLRTAISLVFFLLGTGFIHHTLHGIGGIPGFDEVVLMRDQERILRTEKKAGVIQKTTARSSMVLSPVTRSNRPKVSIEQEESHIRNSNIRVVGDKVEEVMPISIAQSIEPDEDLLENEIENLMRRARINVNLEQTILRKRKKAAHELLVEVEEGMVAPVHKKKGYEKIKRGFKKLKTTLAN